MLEADHLTVSGDVSFGKDVSLKVRRLSFICIIYCSLTKSYNFDRNVLPNFNL